MGNESIIEFDNREQLFRAVLNKEMYWDSNNRVTSAAFALRDGEYGLSVERSCNRSIDECCRYILSHLNGRVIYFVVEDCNKINDIQLIYCPSEMNPFHSELRYGGLSRKQMYQIQHQLIRIAKYIR